MPPEDETLLRRLRTAFKEEAREHVQTIASGLVSLEMAETDAQADILEKIFRAAHSLKGAARTVNIASVEAVCQALESVFAELRKGHLQQTPELFDLLQQATSSLAELLPSDVESSTEPLSPEARILVRKLRTLAKKPALSPSSSSPGRREQTKASPAVPPEAPKHKAPAVDRTVRVSAVKLEAMMGWVEELVSARLAATEQTRRLRYLAKQPEIWRRHWSRVRESAQARASTTALTAAGEARIAEFTEWSESFHVDLENALHDVSRVAARDERVIGALVDHLLDELKIVALQPFSLLLDMFPMTVRELARRAGKEVELILEGGEMEMDRRILDKIKDPLIHIVRNCIDHGIETPAEREARGKARRGKLRIAVTPHNGTSVRIDIVDDGAGIDAARVRSAAVQSGYLSGDQAKNLSDEEAIPLIFESGLSTRQKVTDLSGRGVGLAIVRQAVEMLNGSVSVTSILGQGATFHLALPVTLARFRGLIVRVNAQLFVLPTRNVTSVARVRREEVKTVENRPSVALRGESVAVASLRETLGIEATPEENPSQHLSLAIVTSENHRIAFAVDEILYEDEVLVKPLGHPLKRVRHVSSATALSNGRVAAILHVPDLLASALQADGLPTSLALAAQSAPRRRAVLVAEDSITSRTLLRAILESAGFRVETAADGVEALSKLRAEPFDAVVSDVDMPRLNGFGLTAKIRADRRLETLPIVLVTALEKAEDREHGLDVGASAYLIKSSFDQSNLLEVLNRLL